MSLRPAIRYLNSFVLDRTGSQYIFRTSFRYLKDKHWNKELTNVETKDDKELAKIKIILKDQDGNIMGNKSLIEARLLAQKLRLNLVEDNDVLNHFKLKAFKLVSNQYLAQEVDKDLKNINENVDSKEPKGKSSSPSAQTVREVKHLVFSSKLNENDLMTKIKQLKRWLSRGHQIHVNINNPKNDRQILEQILTKFESELKSVAKINQKKIKSNNMLKFVVLPVTDGKEQLNNTADSHISDDIDMDNLDPNKLLSDEFGQELEKK